MIFVTFHAAFLCRSGIFPRNLHKKCACGTKSCLCQTVKLFRSPFSTQTQHSLRFFSVKQHQTFFQTIGFFGFRDERKVKICFLCFENWKKSAVKSINTVQNMTHATCNFYFRVEETVKLVSKLVSCFTTWVVEKMEKIVAKLLTRLEKCYFWIILKKKMLGMHFVNFFRSI